MKHIKIVFCLAFFSMLFLNSCSGDDEPIDPALLIDTPASCSEPSFLQVSALINGNTVSIDWDKTSGEIWEIQYGASGFQVGTGTTVNFTPTSSLIGGLVATTNYQFYIRTKCADDDFSVWVGPVTPGSIIEVCVNPTNVTAVRSNTDVTKVTVSWSANGDENSWQVQYGAAGFTLGAGTITASATPTKVISGLVGTTSYQFYVRSNCSANENSDWVGPITVNAVGGASSCTTPTNLTAVRSLNTQALLTWNAGGTETSWEIQYGNVGFAVGTGTSVISTTTSKTITGLGATSYDFYVRAKCSATQNSAWFGPVNIAAVGVVDNTPALMTANIAGVQYNNMKPFMYPMFTDAVSVANENADVSMGEHKYLHIQGNTSNDLDTMIELNIYIPDNLWQAGNYTLFGQTDLSTSDICQLRMYSDTGSTALVSNTLVNGTISIIEFNLATRRVKGTFTYSYEKTIDGVSAGIFQVTNGTFNYPLDDPYFD